MIWLDRPTFQIKKIENLLTPKVERTRFIIKEKISAYNKKISTYSRQTTNRQTKCRLQFCFWTTNRVCLKQKIHFIICQYCFSFITRPYQLHKTKHHFKQANCRETSSITFYPILSSPTRFILAQYSNRLPSKHRLTASFDRRPSSSLARMYKRIHSSLAATLQAICT